VSVSDPIQLQAARYQERYLRVGAGVELLLRSWEPEDPRLDWPVVFVPGWISLPQGWTRLLQGLAARQPVFYLETREKASARFQRSMVSSDFSIERCAADLVAISRALPGDPEQRVWLAASLGATILVPALTQHGLTARAALLISPNADFHYPWWVGPITYMPSWLYPPVRDFVLWYLRRFKVDAQREPEQMARYERTMNAAEPTRLKLSARAFKGFELWPILDQLQLPVGVAYASSDTLHAEDDVRRLLQALPGGRGFACPSNLHLHRAELLAELDAFLGAGEIQQGTV